MRDVPCAVYRALGQVWENIDAHALPLCVSRARTVLSKHEVDIEPLFCMVFCDRGCACAVGRGGCLLSIVSLAR
jgi:predicted metal-binding protein